jgi:hypothetical protein
LKKDKNEPKRAPTSYNLFCNDKRAGIVKENPDVDHVEILKKMGELWREAGDDVKAKYAEKSKKLSAVANEKIQAYRKEKQDAEVTGTADHDSRSDGGGGKEDMSVDEKPKPATKKSKLKKEKDKNEPKRAPTSCNLFYIEENPDVDQVEILKMRKLWREAGDDVKAKYAEKSKKLWRRFRRIAKRNKRQR